MTHSRHEFNNIARPEAKKADYPPPFSLRLTYEERARLDAERGGMTLAAYIRERLFGTDAAPRKKRGNSPVHDKEAFGRMAGALGQSRLSQNMNQHAKANPELAKARKPRTPWQWLKGSAAEKEARRALQPKKPA